jgi:hypothetical protein
LAILVKELATARKACVLAVAIGLLLLFPLLNRFAPEPINMLEEWTIWSALGAAWLGILAAVCALLVRWAR